MMMHTRSDAAWTSHTSSSLHVLRFTQLSSTRWGAGRSNLGDRNTIVSAASKRESITAHDDQEPALRVTFAAGGTGGHVFPAIAIADALTASHNVTVHFVGTHHRIEASAVPSAGYPLHHIPAVPLRRPIFSLRNLLLPFNLLISLLSALRLLLKFRPHVVVGTGGYVSFPVCIAAILCGCPFVIQEQNARPGVANKLLARFATSVFVAFPDAQNHLAFRKCIVSGNPLRCSLHVPVPKLTALQHFFSTSVLDRTAQCGLPYEVLLIQGGSLGAKSINQAAVGFMRQMLGNHPQRLVIWQTGLKHFKEVTEKTGCHQRMFITEFLHDMGLAYATADLVVACSGAITCSELLVLGKPSILIPLKYVVDDHQRNNALVLQTAGASKVLDDDGLRPEILGAAIDELIGDKIMLARMSENALKAAMPNAADYIAQEILSLACKRAFRKVPGIIH